MNPLEITGCFDFDPEEIIRAAGHQIALTYLGVFTNGAFEPVEKIFRLPVEGYLDNDRDNFAASGTARQRRIAPDNPFPLQNIDPPQTGGWRQSDLCGELGVADAGVQSQHSDDMAIGSVQS